MKRIPLPTIITAAALILILVIYALTFQVRFNEAAVRVRFGRPASAAITAPGLKFRWPPPFETVQKYDTRLRVLNTNESEIKTRDGQNIVVGCFAVWRVADPLQFLIRVKSIGEAEKVLRQRIEEIRATVIGRHDLAEFVNLDRGAVDSSFDTIQAEMLADAGQGIRTDYGIELSRVAIRRISLPDSATQTVQEAMKKDRERLATRYTKEGEAAREAIKAEAESVRDRILQFADRRAQEITSEGVKATTGILASIQAEDEDFYLWLRSLEALEASLKQKATIFMDSSSELFDAFMRPEVSRAAESPAAPPGGEIAASPGDVE